eukprot:2372119-Prymnesium_polylepis.1
MALHWWHSPGVEAPPMPKLQGAMTQLTCNGLEDKCRLGNVGELKGFLHNIPIRINVDFFVVRKVMVEMTDLFAGTGSKTGAKAGAESHHGYYDEGMQGVARIEQLAFAPFTDNSIYDF